MIAKVNALPVPALSGRELQPPAEMIYPYGYTSATERELSPTLRSGDVSALTSSPSIASGMPSMLDRAFEGEL
jgi:hypothetical protein